MISTNEKTIVDGNADSDFPFHLFCGSYVQATIKTETFQRDNYGFCTMEFVLEGSGYLEINGEMYEPGPGSVYILQKGSDHKYWPNHKKPWKKAFFIIDGEFMEYLFKIYQLDELYYLEDGSDLLNYFDEMIRLNNVGDTVHSRASIIFHRMLEEIRSKVYGIASRVPDDVRRMKGFLDENIEKKVNLEDVCKRYGRSSAHMIRQFKESYGASPYDYLMQSRVESARLLLQHSDLLIKEIANRLQFSDQYYFSNYFKRKVGVSPKQFRSEFIKNL